MTEEDHLRAAIHCCKEVIKSRQMNGQPIPEWMRRHHANLNFRASQLGHENSRREGQLKQDRLITAKEAADMLGCSKRQVQRIASDLDGSIVGGRWLFSYAAVNDYVEGKRSA